MTDQTLSKRSSSTAAPIIDDAEAKRIAQDWARLDPDDATAKFAATGAIETVEVRDDLTIARREEGPHMADEDRREINALLAYVAHHGERPAVAGWEAI